MYKELGRGSKLKSVSQEASHRSYWHREGSREVGGRAQVLAGSSAIPGEGGAAQEKLTVKVLLFMFQGMRGDSKGSGVCLSRIAYLTRA